MDADKNSPSEKKTNVSLSKIIAFGLMILALTIVFIAIRFSLKEYNSAKETEKEVTLQTAATSPTEHQEAAASSPVAVTTAPLENPIHKQNQILGAAYNLEISLNQGQVSAKDIEVLRENITDPEVKAALADLELFGMNVVDKDEFHEEAVKSRKAMILLERKAENDDRYFSNYIGNFVFITSDEQEGADRRVNEVIRAITKQDYAGALGLYEKLSTEVKNKHASFENKLQRLVKLQNDLNVIRAYITKESGTK